MKENNNVVRKNGKENQIDSRKNPKVLNSKPLIKSNQRQTRSQMRSSGSSEFNNSDNDLKSD